MLVDVERVQCQLFFLDVFSSQHLCHSIQLVERFYDPLAGEIYVSGTQAASLYSSLTLAAA